jgi:NADP-dependent 3-hydroxy acid dehydrogenase YdfG
MPLDLTNKVVLITGASSGFGEEAARLFAREGCKVVLAARRLDRLQALVAQIQNEGGEALAVPVDISQPAEIEVMVQTALDLYGKIDILVNNAGYGSVDWFENLDPERNIDTIIRVNLIGTMLVTRAVLPQMLERGKGHIINMSSVAGLIAAPLITTYSASKYGVRGVKCGPLAFMCPEYIRVLLRLSLVKSSNAHAPAKTSENLSIRISRPNMWLIAS